MLVLALPRPLRILIVPVALVLLCGSACVERTPPPPVTGARTAPCPEPRPDVICTKEYRPVVCDGCRYSNPCLAGAAGFTAEQCAPAEEEAAAREKPCPEPSPEVICPMIYDPVICNGCRYSNGCVAGAAGFEKEQCAPAPEE